MNGNNTHFSDREHPYINSLTDEEIIGGCKKMIVQISNDFFDDNKMSLQEKTVKFFDTFEGAYHETDI